jgi:lactate permease
MVKVMCTWKQTREVWPALAVAGGSFAFFQFTFATFHLYVRTELWPMTDIGGGIFSLVVTAIFLQFWKPRNEWHFDKQESGVGSQESEIKTPLNAWTITVAWGPYIIMSILLMLTGLVRQQEAPVRAGPGPVQITSWLHTNYQVPVPFLHNESHRDPRLHAIRDEHAVLLMLAADRPLQATINIAIGQRIAPRPEGALFNFAWLTAPGTAVFVAALMSMALLRMNREQIKVVIGRTFYQMKIPIPTIACMLGLSYVTRYAGMDATLGVAFAETGVLYPFFAAILGWLGVFLTGTDAGSNALFGSLQKITASEVYKSGAFHYLTEAQSQVLICTANSTGGVMGKMIDAQSICVATAATHQIGREADIFKAVVWHSIVLAALVGLIVLLQAYVYPFTLMVPTPP